jgi:hypothetical protein
MPSEEGYQERTEDGSKKAKVWHPKGMFFCAHIALKKRFLILRRAFLGMVRQSSPQEREKRLISSYK